MPTLEQQARAREALQACFGNKTEAARSLGLPRSTFREHLNETRPKFLQKVKGREYADIENGIVLIASDGHYWPGEPTTAHRAFLKFCEDLKPEIVVFNGDVLDAPTISRHPPIGWDHCPTLKDELKACEARLNEIVGASGKAKRYWPLGNHDGRFETRLAQAAPEFRGVEGLSLADRFPEWEPCWSLFINDDIHGVVVKHRFKGGIHATHNATLWAGRSMVTGHLHSLKVTPVSDYNGTRWGVDSGTLADPTHPAFQDYTEDNPRNWRSGFVVLTFCNGKLMWPEVVHVVGDGQVEFRGEIIDV